MNTEAEYTPKDGDVVTAVFQVTRAKRGYTDGRKVTTWREVFGAVQRVTPTRVLVQTLKTSAFGFSKTDVWVPRDVVKPADAHQTKRWRKAMGECDAFVGMVREVVNAQR